MDWLVRDSSDYQIGGEGTVALRFVTKNQKAGGNPPAAKHAAPAWGGG
jgi:hypothetical protein